MPNATHTKGKWIIRTEPVGNKYRQMTVETIIDGHRRSICDIVGIMTVDEANASLIAASPLLLEALINLANQTVINEHNGHCFKAAREAIALAEGTS